MQGHEQGLSAGMPAFLRIYLSLKVFPRKLKCLSLQFAHLLLESVGLLTIQILKLNFSEK